METRMNLPTERLINELQTFGVRLADPKAGLESRRGGAGPSDHKAITVDGVTVMAPVHTAPAFESPYVIDKPDAEGKSRIARDGKTLAEAAFVARPRFYDLQTDPFELHNIAYRLSATQLADLHQELMGLENCHTGDACWAAGHVGPGP